MADYIEYRVRPVTRWVVTRFYQHGAESGIETLGEFDNQDHADRVKVALIKMEEPVRQE